MNLNVASHLISASAGTGKTFQLTARFIALLALGVPPAAMIALTFTRKAAQEFQERIISTLALGAEDDERACQLAEVIRRTWKGAKDGTFPPLCPVANETLYPLTCERFGQLLRLLVEEMSRLHLSTLDSFFQSLVMMGQPELGLSRVEIVTEDALRRARRKALDALLYDVNTDERHQEVNLEALRAVAESQEMDMVGALEKAVDDYVEVYRSLPLDQLWGAAEAFGLPDVSAHQPLTYAMAMSIQRQLSSCLEALVLKEDEAGALLKLPLDIHFRQYGGLKIVGKLKRQFSDCEQTSWRNLEQVLDQLETQARNDILQVSVRRSRSMARLMRCYLAAYKVEMKDRGYLEYADVTRLVPMLLQREGVPSLLAYRMDARLKHWMLDEFQDTSRIQWEALLPLIQNIAEDAGASPDRAADRSLFVVGDVKQSIYRWRGGEPELFRHLLQDSPWKEALQSVEMNLSWRSSPVVMRFVNRVFSGDSQVQEHRAACTEAEKPGYIRVDCMPKAKQEETYECACERIRDILESLPLQEKAMSVGIIARTNKQVCAIYDRLRGLCPGLPLYMEGQSVPLTQSPLGEVLLALFRWLLHPSDQYRKAELLQSPLWRYGDRKEYSWHFWHKLLQKQGYASVIRSLSANLLPEPGLLSDYHRFQLNAWLQEAIAFDAMGGSLQDWVEHMQNLSVQCPPPKHSVHLLTIHGCKGLEYDAVILPFLEAPQSSGFDHTRHLAYYTACDAEGKITGLLIKDAQLRNAWGEELEAAEQRWKKQAIAEGRNLLYVAITRAVHSNYLIVNGNQGANGKSLGGIIKQALGEDCPLPGQWYETGDADWAQHAGFSLKQRKSHVVEIGPLQTPGRRNRKHRPSEDTELERSLGIPSKQGGKMLSLELGTSVHALLEKITWWDVNAPPSWYLNPIREEERMVRKALDVPEILDLFLQENYPPGTQVYNEQCLEQVVRGEWTSAVIDRLLVCPGGDVLIVDYKTNKNAEGLERKYRGQMIAYQNLVSEALGVERCRVKVYLAAIGAKRPHLECLDKKATFI